MKNLMEHPTVKRVQEKMTAIREAAGRLDAAWLRQLALDLGADDVGFVELGRGALAADREDILTAFPRARSLVGLVCRMNREPILSPARSVANLESTTPTTASTKFTARSVFKAATSTRPIFELRPTAALGSGFSPKRPILSGPFCAARFA